MPIQFSDRMVDRIEAVGSTLISPLDHETEDGWFAEVAAQAADLLDADVATIQLISSAQPEYFSSGFPLSALTDYGERVRRLPVELQREFNFSYLRRMAAARVWSRTTLHGAKLPEYYRSSYYNEFVVPLRGFDAIGITVAPAGKEAEAVSSSLLLHHTKRSGRKFGERGVSILRLLFPFFRAGIGAYRALGRQGRDLGRAIDAFSTGVQVFDHRRRPIARNRALADLLLAAPSAIRETVTAAMDNLAGHMLPLSRGGRRRGDRVDHGPSVRVAGRYLLQGTRLGDTLLPTGRPGVLVSVTMDADAHPTSKAQWRERYGLTRREAEVAALLGERLTNGEIAARLFISPHTARRHTERVLAKLRIESRRDVATVLHRDSNRPDA